MNIFDLRSLLAVAVLLPTCSWAQGVIQNNEASPQVVAGVSSGRPANLCQELLAFVRQPAAVAATGAPPAPLATAVQAPASGTPASKPSDASGSPQQASGLSGQVTSGGPGASGPQGSTQNAAAPSGAAAGAGPVPVSDQASRGVAPSNVPAPQPPAPALPVAPKPTAAAIERVEAAARDNDVRGCRDVAQLMRRAGVAMPPPLLALAAMDPIRLEHSIAP